MVLVNVEGSHVGLFSEVLVALSLPSLLFCLALMRDKSAVDNLETQKLLMQNDEEGFLSMLTVTQALQLPCSKVSPIKLS